MNEMLKGMITEAELLKLMSLKPSELSYLRREKGLPFVKLTMRTRVYLEVDLMKWFIEHRIILNRDMIANPIDVDTNKTDADLRSLTQVDAG